MWLRSGPPGHEQMCCAELSVLRPPPWPPRGRSGEHSGPRAPPPTPPRARRHAALEPKGCLVSRALQRQAESPRSRVECSSPRQPSLGPCACPARPAWPLACLLQRSVSLPAPPPSSVGTFARALDCSSSVRQPSLHMSAAAASRDITLVSRCQPSKAQHVCLGQPPGHGPTQGRALGALAWQPRLRTGSG